MDRIFRTPEGGLIYLASDPKVISAAEQRERGMRPNGFPEGTPTDFGQETIKCALRKKNAARIAAHQG